MLSVKASVSLLLACQLISSCSEMLLLSATEIIVERDFVSQLAVLSLKTLDLSDVCWLSSFSPEGL